MSSRGRSRHRRHLRHRTGHGAGAEGRGLHRVRAVPPCPGRGGPAPHLRRCDDRRNRSAPPWSRSWPVEGRIDILVNNAGFGISGAVEFTATEDAKSPVRRELLRHGEHEPTAVVPHDACRRGDGRIVNLSSVAAPVPIPFQTLLLRHQGGGERLHHGLGQRAAALRRDGVRRHARRHPHRLHRRPAGRSARETTSIRAASAAPWPGWSTMRRPAWTPPEPAAYVARVALREGSHHPLYAIRIDYKFFVFLTKVLPAGALNRLVYLIYGK